MTDINQTITETILKNAGGKITWELINQLKDIEPELAASLEKKLIEGAAGNTKKFLKLFITEDPRMLRLKSYVEKIALIDDPVLIQGDSGTGKELLARALHGDREGEFLPINCSGIPEQLIESELFGHERGAFTGAMREKDGLMVVARKGTLFLDEIGDMPLLMQGKLLRALQEKVVRRVGGNTDIKISCRVVAATHKNLEQMVNYGGFRNDLFWRLNGFILRPSPLKERVADIPLIVESLDDSENIKDIEMFCSKIDKAALTGNVRSLQQLVRRYVILGLYPGESL